VHFSKVEPKSPLDGDWGRLAPMRILSFDIECFAEVGFPEVSTSATDFVVTSTWCCGQLLCARASSRAVLERNVPLLLRRRRKPTSSTSKQHLWRRRQQPQQQQHYHRR
jgi:hypothetical protein